jgi:hypothetical protein
MAMKISTFFASAALAVSALALPAGAANLLLNPGFESGTGADADNWTEIEASGDPLNATPSTDRVGTDANTGSFSARLSYTNTATPGTGSNSELQQQTALNSIVPGEAYDYTFFAKRLGEFGPGTVVFAQVLFLDSDGSAGGGVKGSSGLQVINGVTESYQQFSITNITAPVDSDAALVSLQLAGGAVPSATGTMFVDDVSLAAVPEPAAFGLIGAGTLGVLARRRREV